MKRNIHILFGPPGCGKTSTAEQAAVDVGAALVFYQCHEWSDADELFVGVDVQAAVAGDAENVRQPGVLAQAAEKSQQGRVVLVIDELDKASDRVEALLLDFLQSGRVPIKPNVHVQANLDNLKVYITSNEARPHSEALLRRARRRFMQPLPVAKVEAIIIEKTGASAQLVRAIWKTARQIAQAEGNNALSVQEGEQLTLELLEADSYEATMDAFVAWGARSRTGAAAATKNPAVSTVWGMLNKNK